PPQPEEPRRARRRPAQQRQPGAQTPRSRGAGTGLLRVRRDPRRGRSRQDRRAPVTGRQPPAMAPTMQNGSAPVATAGGSGASAGSRDRSSSPAKNRTNGRRRPVARSRIVPPRVG